MALISLTLLQLLDKGEHVLATALQVRTMAAGAWAITWKSWINSKVKTNLYFAFHLLGVWMTILLLPALNWTDMDWEGPELQPIWGWSSTLTQLNKWTNIERVISTPISSQRAPSTRRGEEMTPDFVNSLRRDPTGANPTNPRKSILPSDLSICCYSCISNKWAVNLWVLNPYSSPDNPTRTRWNSLTNSKIIMLGWFLNVKNNLDKTHRV